MGAQRLSDIRLTVKAKVTVRVVILDVFRGGEEEEGGGDTASRERSGEGKEPRDATGISLDALSSRIFLMASYCTLTLALRIVKVTRAKSAARGRIIAFFSFFLPFSLLLSFAPCPMDDLTEMRSRR